MGFAASIIALAGAAAAPQPADIGPTPTFEAAVKVGEAAIRASLIDPDSAKIEWPYNFVGGSLKALLGKREDGFFTCGFVNSRNRMGGYSGRSWFLIMERDGVVTSLAIAGTEGVDQASATCPGLVKKGMFPPAPAPAAADSAQWQRQAESGAAESASKGGLGISITPTPYGSMLVAISPKSPAEAAGLKPGEVIEAVNGIAVKGMDPASVAELIGRAGPAVSLSIVGVGVVTVRR